MSTGAYIGIGGVKKGKACYVGVHGNPCKVKEIYAGVNGTVKRVWRGTVPAGQRVFTASQVWTIPDGVTTIDVFCVGGGGSGGIINVGHYLVSYSGSTIDLPYHGGCGGYTQTQKGLRVTPGTSLAITIGSGGAAVQCGFPVWENNEFPIGVAAALGNTGGTTQFGTDCTASGGGGGSFRGIFGGSGGGTQANGGSDGSDGGYNSTYVRDVSTIGHGQGTTTRSFGEAGGTLYAGGGGGNTYLKEGIGYGGSGGGGNAPQKGNYQAWSGYDNRGYIVQMEASPGGANTGGGGGGCEGAGHYNYGNSFTRSGAGGSGVVIIRWAEQ